VRARRVDRSATDVVRDVVKDVDVDRERVGSEGEDDVGEIRSSVGIVVISNSRDRRRVL